MGMCAWQSGAGEEAEEEDGGVAGPDLSTGLRQ